MTQEVLALLDRIATALEESNEIAHRQEKVYAEARAEARRNHVQAQQSSTKLHNLLSTQAKRQATRDKLHDRDIAARVARDEELLRLLRAAGERGEDTLDALKTVTRTKAPDFVPDNLVPVPDDEGDEGAD